MMTFNGELRWVLMIFCVLIFTAAFALMVVSAWVRHRGGTKDATNFHKSIAVELCWALAPLIMVAVMVWPTARLIFKG
jgi:cytochrome c oxidase subunit 2